MTDALTKPETPLDSFTGYDDGTEGDEQSQGRGVIHGTCIKFSNEGTWLDRDGQEVPETLELVVVDIRRVVQKWEDHAPIETITVAPGEKFPDVEKMNEETPREEWTEGPDGHPRGPWQRQSIVYLLNAETMDKYSYPTGTTGGFIAVRDLTDRTLWMRRYRGAGVYPAVVLSDKFMPTKWGGRQRPHFEIKRWVAFGADQQVLPAPQSPALPAPADTAGSPTQQPTQSPKTESAQSKPVTAATKQPRKAAKLQTVEEPSKDEEFNDSIPHL